MARARQTKSPKGAMIRKPGAEAKRTFTAAEANAALPLVRAIVSDLVKLARDVSERRQRLLSLSRPGPRRGTDPYEEELVQMEEELDSDAHRLLEYVEELRQLGVEAKGVMEGLVDFPAVKDDRKIYLCWRLGEPQVAYWHELDAGFRGRQPLGDLPDGPVKPGIDAAS